MGIAMLFDYVRLDPPQRLLLGAGLVAPVLYAATVVAGEMMTPGYDPMKDAISALLIGEHAPLIEPFFLVYNLSILGFGWGVINATGRRGRYFVTGAAMLALGGVLGLIMAFFPMDAVGTPVTPAGGMHIALAALMSLASMSVLFCFGLALRAVPGAGPWAAYAFASLAVVFSSGGFAALGTAASWPTAGLLERLTIGTYLLWVFVTAFGLMTNASGLARPAERTAS